MYAGAIENQPLFPPEVVKLQVLTTCSQEKGFEKSKLFPLSKGYKTIKTFNELLVAHILNIQLEHQPQVL